ncbi:MAG: helix-turn-helix transcriptional regulator [Lentisphaeria bacterium]|nr:helix-turn-helix transcriptional regulator [Lentisphaeria bacterium]
MLDEQIKTILEQEEASGMTHRQMGLRHSIDPSQITRYLRGKRPYSGITIETLMKMFPLATLNLNGDASLTLNGTNNGVVGGNIGTVNTAPPIDQTQIKAAVDAFRHEVIDAVIGLDIPPDALATVLKTIKELAQ